MQRRAVMLGGILAIAAAMPAQVQLVRDINLQPGPNPSSRPDQPVRLNGVTYFAAESAGAGREIFSTVVGASVSLFMDLRPGVEGSAPRLLTVAGTGMFFQADDGVSGRELWRTDGSPAGTMRVVDLRPGLASSDPESLVAFGNGILFTALDSQGQRGLYRSDGTAPGTQKIFDVAARNLHAAGSFVWFHGPGQDLWRTDGTAAGTLRVFPAPSTQPSSPVMFVSGRYCFASCVGPRTVDLFATDGTAAGVTRLETIGASVLCLGGPGAMGVHLGKAWFFNGASQTWVTDGTVAGTEALPLQGSVSAVATFAGSVYGLSTFLGSQLWKSDGTTSGTVVIASTGSRSAGLAVAGSRMYFSALDASGAELWTSDGTTSGTHPVVDLHPGAASSNPSVVVELPNGMAMFAADDGVHGREPWVTGGTAATTRLVADILPSVVTLSSNPRLLAEHNGQVFFSADDGIHGVELWTSDGSPAGTRMVADLAAAGSAWPESAVVIDGRIYFLAFPGGPMQLFVTDGTTGGTRQLTNFPQGVGYSGPLARVGKKLYFVSVESGQLGAWHYDASTGAQVRFATIPWPNAYRLEFAESGGVVYFVGYDAQHGFEPWRTDGTPGGTRMIAETVPGPTGSQPASFTPWRGHLVFTAATVRGNLHTLWRTDGTAAGTQVLGSQMLLPREFVATDRWLFFTASHSPGRGLARTDGTAANTAFVQPFLGIEGPPARLGDDVLVPAFTTAEGTELWRSDGSLGNMRRVSDIESGRHGRAAALHRVGSRHVYFSGLTLAESSELWRSDGTLAGTTLVQDLNPGFYSGMFGRSYLVAGGWLYFVGDNGRTGEELFRVRLDAVAESVGQPCGVSGASLRATDPVLGGSIRVDGASAPANQVSGSLLIGIPPSFPLFDCYSYIGQIIALDPVSGVSFSRTYPIPNDKSAIGARVVLQAWYVTRTGGRGFELSNAVDLTLGR